MRRPGLLTAVAGAGVAGGAAVAGRVAAHRRAAADLRRAAAAATRGRRPRVVVVGGGFGGLSVARSLRGAPVDAVVVDRHNYHLFQPLLYQVASALLDPSEIAHPTRPILHGAQNVTFRLGTVTGIDLARRRLLTDSGALEYDHLVLAAGSVNNFFGNRSVEEHAHTLKDLGGGLALRNHVLSCFERAAWTDDPAERRRLLTFVVVGAGPTGVEYAGALTELINLVLRRDFPGLDLGAVRVILVEAAHEVLAGFDPPLRRAGLAGVRAKGVEVWLDSAVEEVGAGEVRLAGGRTLSAETVVWTAGVRASPVGAMLGTPLGRNGRVPVEPTLQLAGHPEVHVIGDLAEYATDDGPLPMLAPVAIQQGALVAHNILATLAGREPRPFRYFDKGTMATIGRNAAVAQIGPVHLTGFPGWVAWLGVHLIQLIGFRSRIVVLVNWAWDYFFYDRPVRLIAGPAPPAAETEGGTRSAGEPAGTAPAR